MVWTRLDHFVNNNKKHFLENLANLLSYITSCSYCVYIGVALSVDGLSYETLNENFDERTAKVFVQDFPVSTFDLCQYVQQ